MKIVWLDEASDDLDAIGTYIARHNPMAAAKLQLRIVEAVERLADMPLMGRIGRVRNTRELVVSGTPYLVPYRLTSGRVEILRVFHGVRRWPKRF